MNPLGDLITQLSKLPGIGQRSAQRLAFFFLSWSSQEVNDFAKTLVNTHRDIQYCQSCFNISFSNLCNICENNKRDQSQLCVVAEPKDILAIERTGEYKGLYHVLGGLLSPIDGIQPDTLRIQELMKRLHQERFSEVICAINPTIEGEATILYLKSMMSSIHTEITKLAYGLPIGSNIDYADDMTLQKALSGRRRLE